MRAKCWQGWRLSLVSLEAGRENRPFSFIGEMREGWVVGSCGETEEGEGLLLSSPGRAKTRE